MCMLIYSLKFIPNVTHLLVTISFGKVNPILEKSLRAAFKIDDLATVGFVELF